jgi:biopolymer transport protein TolQ
MLENTSYSIVDLIKQADIVVQVVMIVLALASVWSWTLAFDKIFKFFILKIKTNRFEETFTFTRTMDDIIKLSKRKSTHPFAKILSVAIEEWQLSNVNEIIANNDNDRKNSLKTRMHNAAQVAVDNSAIRLEKGMNFLAITGSVAPFVGLFGTVWGIMNSFQSIAVSKNTSLAVVAPGFAEALLATAIGLFAAIPAVFFYNVYNNKLNNFIDRMNGFSLTVINSLSRNLDKQTT